MSSDTSKETEPKIVDFLIFYSTENNHANTVKKGIYMKLLKKQAKKTKLLLPIYQSNTLKLEACWTTCVCLAFNFIERIIRVAISNKLFKVARPEHANFIWHLSSQFVRLKSQRCCKDLKKRGVEGSLSVNSYLVFKTCEPSPKTTYLILINAQVPMGCCL